MSSQADMGGLNLKVLLDTNVAKCLCWYKKTASNESGLIIIVHFSVIKLTDHF